MAWVILSLALGMLGFAVAYVLALANGMKTAPARFLSRGARIVGSVLPLVTLGVIAMGAVRLWGMEGSWWRLVLMGFAGVASAVSLLILWLPQTGSGPRR